MKKNFVRVPGTRGMLLCVLVLSAVLITACGGNRSGNGSETGNGGDSYDSSKVPVLPTLSASYTTAAELVSQMTIGWNLGNTLDSHNNSGNVSTQTVSQMEGAWIGGRNTTPENINAIKAAGFNTIRIPVTWYKARVGTDDYTIRADWMARVKEIVDYAIDAGDMFVILNTHHDEHIFKFMNAEVDASLVKFKRIWEQIAETFKDYDERLIFEALNEPRTKGSGAEWNGGIPEERANLNKHYEAFVDVVRKSGGNNDKRMLMITTYGASPTAAAMNGLVLPTDTVENRLIVSIHFYEPYNFALNTNAAFNTWSNSGNDRTAITERVDRAYNTFVSKGIPVVIGEFGAMNKNNEQTRANWANFYVSYALSKDIKCVWWDNGAVTGGGELFGLINRSNNTFHYPVLLYALLRAAGVQFVDP